MLEELISSILVCNTDRSLISGVTIIIVDNDELLSASSVTGSLIEDLKGSWVIRYSTFPEKGLANVRNELLRKAFELNPDFIVFVDDDEKVTQEWLNELVKTALRNHGDMVMGPVISLLAGRTSRYISCWIERPTFSNNAEMDFIRTGNLLINAVSLKQKNVWFDERFNFTGGEDSYFGKQMIKKGAKIYWAAKAVVHETVPEGRANIRWLIKRYYNGANIYTRILKLENQYFKLFKKILVSFVYIMIGFMASIVFFIPLRKKYWGLLRLSEGIGSVAGLLSIEYNEYGD